MRGEQAIIIKEKISLSRVGHLTNYGGVCSAFLKADECSTATACHGNVTLSDIVKIPLWDSECKSQNQFFMRGVFSVSRGFISCNLSD